MHSKIENIINNLIGSNNITIKDKDFEIIFVRICRGFLRIKYDVKLSSNTFVIKNRILGMQCFMKMTYNAYGQDHTENAYFKYENCVVGYTVMHPEHQKKFLKDNPTCILKKTIK